MFKLVFFVPAGQAEEVKQAVFAVGAGKYEHYDQCSWETEGTGQFRPQAGSNPYIGSLDQVERVTEKRVEVLLREEILVEALEALIGVHPYEEPAYEVYRIYQLAELKKMDA